MKRALATILVSILVTPGFEARAQTDDLDDLRKS